MLLSPPLAHPDPDNSPSVSLCLLWREPCTSQPSAQAHPKPLSLFLWKLCLCPLLSDFTARLFFSASACTTPYFSLISPCLHALFHFSVHPSVFPIHTFLRSFYSTITHPPVRSIYLCVAESFSSHRTPPYATVMESSPPLSSLLSFTGSSSLVLSLPELLLTFCLPTHFKFN